MLNPLSVFGLSNFPLIFLILSDLPKSTISPYICVCMHSFCKNCWSATSISSKFKNKPISCPICNWINTLLDLHFYLRLFLIIQIFAINELTNEMLIRILHSLNRSINIIMDHWDHLEPTTFKGDLVIIKIFFNIFYPFEIYLQSGFSFKKVLNMNIYWQKKPTAWRENNW